jgi:hypothetical protein
MALYIPAGRRRRRTIMLGVAALLLGLVIGLVAGRSTAPDISDQIRTVRDDARQTAAALRVLAIHDEAGTTTGGDDGGAALVLRRTRTELEHEFDRAPWLTRAQRERLLRDLDALEAISDRTGDEFATAAEALAAEIEVTFGVGEP